MGSEEEVKQRMTDLGTDPDKRFALSDRVQTEVERVRDLPASERRGAMAELVQSLQDSRGDETAEGRNLRWSTRVERNGEGITIIDNRGREQTVWYTDQHQMPSKTGVHYPKPEEREGGAGGPERLG